MPSELQLTPESIDFSPISVHCQKFLNEKYILIKHMADEAK